MSTQNKLAAAAGISLLLVLAVLVGSQPARAQALYGSIVGTVVDSSGAAIPGANIKITQTETNQTREAASNDLGAYNIPSVPSGTYSITISKEGFRAYSEKGVVVTISNVVRVDAALAVGAVSESVEVSAQAVTLQTDRAEVRSEVSTRTLEEMPVPVNRNYQNLFYPRARILAAGERSLGFRQPDAGFEFQRERRNP